MVLRARSRAGNRACMPRPTEPPHLTALLRRSFWTESEAREVLSAVDASGASLADFARHHGLTYKRLWNWRRRFLDTLAAPTTTPPAFVELPAPRAARGASRCTLRLVSGETLRFDAAIDPAALRALLSALRAPPC